MSELTALEFAAPSYQLCSLACLVQHAVRTPSHVLCSWRHPGYRMYTFPDRKNNSKLRFATEP